MVALHRGRHLDAAVAGDAVEVVLIALVAAAKGAAKPEAGLDCSSADEMVSLLRQGLLSLNVVHTA